MKKVVFTVGPRGAGKTTFCKKVVASAAGIAFANRDEFLTGLYGKSIWDGQLSSIAGKCCKCGYHYS